MGKVCCFIGHRNVKKTTELKEKLTKTLHWLITEKEVDKFLFGSKSNFDDFCQEIVKGLKEEYPHIKRVYVRMYYPELGEQYMEYILRDFEDTYMPERIENAGIARYVERNQEMIDGSDYCVFYFDENYKPPRRKYSKRSVGDYQPKNGTKVAFDYANQRERGGKGITIINLYETEYEKIVSGILSSFVGLISSITFQYFDSACDKSICSFGWGIERGYPHAEIFYR